MTDSTAEKVREPVYEFDMMRDERILDNIQDGYLHLMKNAPKVFWTPANGGHWVTTSAKGVIEVVRNPDRFSSRYINIPKQNNGYQMIPEMLDPPEHREYRNHLRPYFESKAIKPLEPRIIEWTEKLIDEVAGSGSCEFVDAVASRLPVAVFMELFGFPMDQIDEFRHIVVNFFDSQSSMEARMQLAGRIHEILGELIAARTAEPQDDVYSKIIHKDFQGRKLDTRELLSIGFLMFLAGLDTVTNAMTFGMRHLAHDDALRTRMHDDPDCIPAAVEELMRRYTFVSTARYIVADTKIDGVPVTGGDMVVAPYHMVGFDEKLNPCPENVDIDRPACRHAGFGSGVHTCLGIHLARMELINFYKVWFRKIGHFREDQSKGKSRIRAGSVQAMETLHLEWDVKQQ
ncbi:MAG: cytochrome P450 [Blastomonas sp.]